MEQVAQRDLNTATALCFHKVENEPEERSKSKQRKKGEVGLKTVNLNETEKKKSGEDEMIKERKKERFLH